MQAVIAIIGPRSFAVVPVLGRTHSLGVLLVDRVGDGGFTTQERELLLTYAERVGTELESESFQGTAQRLEQLGQVTLPPPSLLFSTLDPVTGVLSCQGGPQHGQPLHQVLGLDGPEALDGPGSDLVPRLLAGESVTLTLSAAVPSVIAELTLPLPLRVTLRQVPSVPGSAAHTAGQPPHPSTYRPLVCVAVEELTWTQDLRRELVLAKERLAKVMGAIGDAILTLDKSGAVQQANDATQTVLGVAPAELYGSAGLDLAATPRARSQLGVLSDRLKQLGFAEIELRLLRRRMAVPGAPGSASSGAAAERPQRFLARLSALLLCDENGAPEGAVWRIQDLTDLRRDAAERHRLRLRLMQSERLSALGEMAARIAHEVRNPMVSIGAAAQVVAEELPDSSPVRGEALAICSEVRRLDHILSNVLRFARPPRAVAQRTDVNEALREVLDLMRAKTSGLSLQIDASSTSGPVGVLIDADQLKQILWNILLNACDAARTPQSTPQGAALAESAATGDAQPKPGVVECAVRRRRALRPDSQPRSSSGETPPTVLITIADSGPGIPAPLRRRVFDPFFSTKTRGTGLGLSISKQIIESAGGRIRLLNRPGGGTRVVLELLAAP